MPADCRVQVLVAGASSASEEELKLAEEVGRLLAEQGAIVLTGGLGGVMEACSKGALSEGGLTVGILPGLDKRSFNRFVGIRIITGMGNARNVINVASADSVIALSGGWGTLSEIALAKKLGIPVVAIRSWRQLPDGVEVVETPREAVERALELAREGWVR